MAAQLANNNNKTNFFITKTKSNVAFMLCPSCNMKNFSRDPLVINEKGEMELRFIICPVCVQNNKKIGKLYINHGYGPVDNEVKVLELKT